jgi:two-component system phosphate regulon response regulator PhoB
MRILIADEASVSRRTAAAQLRADGYEVIETADGTQALELARSHAPDLIVVERTVPGIDGFGVIEALNADPRTKTLPIVLLSEQPTEEEVLRGLRLGVRDYIAKPFSPRDLSSRVRMVLWRNTA